MKNTTKRLLLAITFVLLSISMLTACGSSQNNTSQSNGKKVINIGITNDPANVNPLENQNATSTELSRILFLPLAQKNEKLEFVPRLAESITTTDNVTFTIKLNKNVKWTDGQDVTADDVIFTLNTILNKKVGSRSAASFTFVAGTDDSGFIAGGNTELSGVKKLDDDTLTITTKYPVTLDIFNNNVSENLRTVPKHILKDENPETIFKSAFIQKPTVSNGAFKFKEYVAGQYLSLTANKDYFLGAPKIDELNFKILPGTQITAQLGNGEIDMNWSLSGNIPAEDYDRVKSFDNVRTIEGKACNVQVLFINNKVINNVKARQAIDLAIDRDSILKNILKNEADIFKTPVTNQIKYWNGDVAKATYDQEKARKLLAESGWDTSKQLTFYVPTGNSTREKVAAVIAEQLKAIGFNINIQKGDLPTTLAAVQKTKYDLSIIGMPDVPLDIVQYLKVYAATAYTWTNYSNPRADELVKIIQTSTDEKVLQETYFELQKLIAEDVPVTGIWADHALKAVNKRVIYGEPKEYGYFLELEKWDVK